MFLFLSVSAKRNKQRRRNRNKIEKFLPEYLPGIVNVFYTLQKHPEKRMASGYEYFLSDVYHKTNNLYWERFDRNQNQTPSFAY